MASISPFNILLNNLSSELSTMNLQSLINVCGELICECERERIFSGWDVFKILIRRNAIGEEPRRMVFLLKIVKELRPKRRDLVDMVKKYIDDYCEEPQEILNGFEFSSDDHMIIPRPSTPKQEDCCLNVGCGCCSCSCNCNPCCTLFCCHIILAISLIILAVVFAELLWFLNKIRHSGKHCHHSKTSEDYDGAATEAATVARPDRFWPVIITVISFLLVLAAFLAVLLGLYIRRRKRKLLCTELQSAGDISVYGSTNSRSADCTKTIERPNSRRLVCSCSFRHMTAVTMCFGRANESADEAMVSTDVCARQQDEPVHAR